MDILTNLTITSLRIDATNSRSYSHEAPIAPRETFTGFALFGTLFERGEMFASFCGKENFPDARKSICGTNVNFLLAWGSWLGRL